MKLPMTLRWIALALLGLIIAAAVALGASRLASQQIGIASESVSAGDTLAPPITPAARGRREKPNSSGPRKEGTKTKAQQPIEPVEPAEPEAESPVEAPAKPSSGDDESGGGDGGGPDD